jgi:UDP-glucose:(heptosyl)LPS alpha-1,3-glucosyltransferase
VGLVRRGYSPTGGAERYLLRLASELDRSGHQVLLFSDAAWPREALAEASIAQVFVPARDPVSFARKLQASLPQHPCDALLSLERVFSCDIYRAGDGVHAAWLERRRRFQPAWKRMFSWVNFKHRRLLELERALFSGGALRVIANSEMVKREIVDRFGYPLERIDLVYNGVPEAVAEPMARAEVRQELGLGGDDYVALFVGSGWERKGLRFAWDAAWEVEGLRFLIAGNDRRSFKAHRAGQPDDNPRAYASSDPVRTCHIYSRRLTFLSFRRFTTPFQTRAWRHSQQVCR